MQAPPAARPPGAPGVVVLRGHQANPWELAPWQEPAIAERFAVRYLRSRRGWFDTSGLSLESERAWTVRDLLPPGRLGDLAVRVPGDRYLRLAAASARGGDRPLPGARLLVLDAGRAPEAAPRLQARADGVGDAAVPRRLQERAHPPLPRARARRDRPLPGGDRAGTRVAAAGGRPGGADPCLPAGDRRCALRRRAPLAGERGPPDDHLARRDSSGRRDTRT